MRADNSPSRAAAVNPHLQRMHLKLKDKSRRRYSLRLYICGMTFRSTQAIENIRKICEEYLQGRCDLEIIDIFKRPDQAKEAQIIAAPTLIKLSPLPIHRMVGNMSDTQKVLLGLDLTPVN